MKTKFYRLILILALIHIGAFGGYAEDGNYTELSVDQLLGWDVFGEGYVGSFRDTILQMKEADESGGLMIVSPDLMKDNIILSYEVMSLRPATVLVCMLSIDFEGAPEELSDGYDGNLGPFNEAGHHFFAFNNAAHGVTPFLAKWKGNTPTILARTNEITTQTGRWHLIEVGKIGENLWLSIDGTRILDGVDPKNREGSRIALRIRGTGVEKGSCLIREFRFRTW